MENPLSLNGKKILITGASSGIGKEVAILLSSLGATCAITGRNEERLKETLNMLEGTGHFSIVSDITEDNNLVNDAVGKIGKLNGFVHCAGIEKTLPFRLTTLSDLKEVMSVNLDSFWRLTQEILKKKNYEQENLSIVAISSVAGLYGALGKSAYATSKGALISLCKSLASEYADKKIRFNCICPGYVNTQMLEDIKRLYSDEEKFNQTITLRHPLGIGAPQDVAGSVAYLLSDMSKWVTGSVMNIDGGYGLR